MSTEILLSKDESLEFETLFETYEMLRKMFYPQVGESQVVFCVDILFDTKKVDNSFSHEFGTEVIHSLELDKKSFILHLEMFENGNKESRIEIKLNPTKYLSANEYDRMIAHINSYIDNNIGLFMDL